MPVMTLPGSKKPRNFRQLTCALAEFEHLEFLPDPGQSSILTLIISGSGNGQQTPVEFITARVKVIETARPRKSCRFCEKIVQMPAPTRPVDRSSAGASLLSHILVSRFDDQLPLYRQNEILDRLGSEVPRSTLSGWCGLSMKTLAPLTELIKSEVVTSDRLHTDDTPVDVLGKHFKATSKSGKAKKQGRIWTYVSDDRPFGGNTNLPNH